MNTMKVTKRTQVDMAKEVGIDHFYLNAILRRRKTPSVALAKRIGEVAGIPWTDLFSHIEPFRRSPKT